MKAYSIFDDFGLYPIEILETHGINVTVHPIGIPRPNHAQMKSILEEYDCVIIGTSQKITEDMFENIYSPRIIATASVGLDHIKFPSDKDVTIVNAPKANAQSVAEYIIGCALGCCKRLSEGCKLYKDGLDNKNLSRKPEDLAGRTLGVIGAGNISKRVMEYAQFFGMKVICWTRNPKAHKVLDVEFIALDELAEKSDIISVNLPDTDETKGIISAHLINSMKESCVFISVSRLATVNANALFEKALMNHNFYVCLDIDINNDLIKMLPKQDNIMITPHIAGGTTETRKRMFYEVSSGIVERIKNG